MGLVRLAPIIAALIMAPVARAQTVATWQPYIAEASTRFGVPVPWIERVMLIESRGRATFEGRPIRSSKGAMGLMQLMPATWRAMRDAYGLGPDPDDPRDNILAGTAYLRLMYDRFGYPGLFGAYNAGPGRYAAYLAGVPLPAETRGYLAAVGEVGRGKSTSVLPSAKPAVPPPALFFPVGKSVSESTLAASSALGNLFVELARERASTRADATGR